MLKKFFVKSNVFVILTSVVLSNVLFASEDINIATKDTLNEIATNDLKNVVGSSGKQTAEKNINFRETFKNREFKEFCREMEGCNKCDVSCVIETSLAYSLNPLFFLDKRKNLP